MSAELMPKGWGFVPMSLSEVMCALALQEMTAGERRGDLRVGIGHSRRRMPTVIVERIQRLALEGLSCSEIASCTGVAVPTIKRYARAARQARSS